MKFPTSRTLYAIGIGVWCLTSGFVAQAAEVDYLKQIKPMLRERCFGCHGSLKQEADLRLDTVSLMLTGGDSGQAIHLNEQAAESLILERISTADEFIRMPPLHEGELFTEEQIELIRSWLANGAPAPADEEPEASPEDHWSFKPLVRQAAQGPIDSNWTINAIDEFVSEKLIAAGVSPQPPASRLELIRRLYLDVIGVPPSSDELNAALQDPAEDWYPQLVDRLLADPRYGERWARHWMDIWRYSDWYGLGEELRFSQRHMWHFRDWIIESLNDEKPYDQMVRMMLAADELAPLDENELRASGYLARNFFIFNRDQWMEETTEHVAKGLLGLTMNCSKCHDHKYDPLSQQEYYQFRAFFEPYQTRLDMVAGQPDYKQDGIPRVFDAKLDAETFLYRRGEASMADHDLKIVPGVPKIVAFEELTIDRVELPPAAWRTGLRDGVIETLTQVAASQVEAATARVEATRQELVAAEETLQQIKTSLENGEVILKSEDGSKYELQTGFSGELNRQDWQIISGLWKEFPDRLEQQQDGAQRGVLRLNSVIPENFEATLKYKLLGGSTWRSVGIAFDVVADGSQTDGQAGVQEVMVYLSGAAIDPKIQATYLKNGANQYPGEGRVAHPVQIGEEYEINLKVRGTLINASVNGQHLLAWRSPLDRHPGILQLVTFDALIALQEFSVKPLSSETQLVSPSNDLGDTSNPLELAENRLQTAKSQSEIAQAELEIAQARLDSVTATGIAMHKAGNRESEEEVDSSRKDAIRAERNVAALVNRLALIKAKIDLEKAPADQAETQQAKVAELQGQYDASANAIEAEISSDATYQDLEGATWTRTRFLNTAADDPDTSFPSESTGRRTALANWIVDERNPLTARVAVNHLWTRHFGTSLVSTQFDLGRNGAAPTHPELLNWLAIELQEHHWSLKHLHRLILNSATYQLSSNLSGNPHAVEVDPDNKLMWRRSSIRLESQIVRDAVLALTGEMDWTIGGPSILPADQQASKRRSLYFYHSNNDRNQFLMAFDEAGVTECYVREQSVVPQQALALANSELVLDNVGLISAKISQNAASDTDFVTQSFRTLLGIEATAAEISVCERSLNDWQALPGGSQEDARSKLIWVLINHNDFVTVR